MRAHAPAAITGVCLLVAILSPDSRAQDLLWKFDETGVPVAAKDASGNQRVGKISGEVDFVFPGITGGAYGGFTSPESQVCWEAGGESYIELGRTNLTVALWMKDPGDSGRATIVGVGNPGTHNRSWEVWLGAPDAADGKSSLNLAAGFWTAGSLNYTAEHKVTLKPGTWYFLAMTWHQVGDGFPRAFDVYLAPRGAASLGQPVFSGVVGEGVDAGPADARVFYIGGNIAGWPGSDSDELFAQHFKEGFFGGVIDNVGLWLDRTLSANELDQIFAAQDGISSTNPKQTNQKP